MKTRLLNVKEAAEYTGLKPGTFYNLICRREIPYVKLRRRVFFEKADLDLWIDRSKVEVNPIRDSTAAARL